MIESPRIAIPSLVFFALLAALSPTVAAAQTAVLVADEKPEGAPVTAVEQTPPPARFRLGAQANLVIPVGDYASAAAVAIGGDIRFAWDLHPNVAITFRGGYLHHFGVPNDVTLGFVPLMLGGEYRFFGDGGPTPFITAELGATIGFASGSVSTAWGGASGTSSDSSFALAIGGGYRFGPVDVKALLYAPDVDDLVGFSISVGGDFASF